MSLTRYNGADYAQLPRTDICSRTSQVQTAILGATPTTHDTCSTVFTGELAQITSLDLSGQSISALASGDFAGLTGLTSLDLRNNPSLTLPMSGDRVLLPLVSLATYNGAAYTQPTTDICSRTDAVENAILAATSPTDDVCSAVEHAELAQITSLDLSGDNISALLAGDFAGLTGLTSLDLSDNSLTTLPEDVFDDLAALETLDLRGNSGLTLPMSGDRVLHFLVSLSTYNGADYTQLPRTDICSRTSPVQTAILAATPTNGDTCSTVVTSQLADITTLDLQNKGITALKSGDFAGLTSLDTLNLSNNPLTALPGDVFDELGALEELHLSGNPLTTLPADVFDGLAALETLGLLHNSLTALPEDVFDELGALEDLNLSFNQLTTLPEDVFDDLTSLTSLNLGQNLLTALPEDVFDGLAALTMLELRFNADLTLPVPEDPGPAAIGGVDQVQRRRLHPAVQDGHLLAHPGRGDGHPGGGALHRCLRPGGGGVPCGHHVPGPVESEHLRPGVGRLRRADRPDLPGPVGQLPEQPAGGRVRRPGRAGDPRPAGQRLRLDAAHVGGPRPAALGEPGHL